MTRLSVLDLSPIVEGSDAAQSLASTLDLARHAERLGYTRYWLAEHHNMPGIASAATAVVIGHVAVAIVSRTDGRDERDRLIEWRAESNSSWILGAGVVMAICGLIVSVDAVWIAHFLLVSLLIAEVAKLGSQLVYYRRGV